MLSSVRNASRILKAFDVSHPEWGIAELSRVFAIPKSTVHQLVCSMVEEGVLVRVEPQGRYRLHLNLFSLSQQMVQDLELVREAEPFLRSLVQMSGETVHLTAYADGDVVFVCKLEGDQPMRLFSMVGKRAPAHAAASGKAMLAYWPEELERLIQEGLRSLTSHTIRTGEALRLDLAEVRRRGYAINREEVDVGVASVGAPIRNYEGEVMAAISVAGPIHRLQPRIERLGDLAKATAYHVSERMGYRLGVR